MGRRLHRERDGHRGKSEINGWIVTIALPSGAAVTGTWNAHASGTSGTVRSTNVSYNGRVLGRQSTEFGFQGTGTGTGTGVTATCVTG
ncbi:cellulose binding domain-containing protein [Micromonospora profundi]|uniref:Cellulose binding domain-containing protein n=1 Tax=Micromonospora profundi TaxID=1420889 RepID=A0AAJ6HS72_9ACTN|nr:cellulose binding domain-containing protein [Micromonospora profundi]WLS43339.1 cellulose binding domain-containing protein [Micromonospora profundi]